MMKQMRLLSLLILFILIISAGLVLLGTQKTIDNSTMVVNATQNVSSITKDDVDVREMFLKIHNHPYKESNTPRTVAQFWAGGGDCDDKARAFADYIASYGEEPRLLNIEYSSGAYSHTVVVWDNLIYDPTTIDPNNSFGWYGVDRTKFLDKMGELGFTGMVIEEPYVKLTPELCQMMT